MNVVEAVVLVALILFLFIKSIITQSETDSLPSGKINLGKPEHRNVSVNAGAYSEEIDCEKSGRVIEFLKAGEKIRAIKELMDQTGCSLADAKEAVEQLEISLVRRGTPPNEEIVPNEMDRIDAMEGHEFEHFCADVLRNNGFADVRVTKGSGDQGADILAEKDGVKYAVQCKNYSTPLGNTPVQEVNAGKQFYGCHVGVVMTNSTFTVGAIELAKVTGVLLWDRTRLLAMLGLPGEQTSIKKKMDCAFAEGQLIGQDEFMDLYGYLLRELNGNAEFMAFIHQLRRKLNGAELTRTKEANKEIMDAFYYGNVNHRFAEVEEIVNRVKAYGKQASAHISIYYAMYVLDLEQENIPRY